ncbi:MAG TPA: class I SAM-dependent methyltransferase [Anaerolineae bacterium]|nr:class I SAM-dependent methyltransferase [Anaerolineae bacterium]
MKWLLSQRIGWEIRVRTVLYRLGLSKTTDAHYLTSYPSPQNAVDILQGEWRSRLPDPLAQVKAGPLSLFEDGRIAWLVEQIGGVEGMTVLELGPLEGAHSYMLEQAGAKCITAIEANSQAYLKCLIVKELLELKKIRFLCGDFVAYLREEPGPLFDLGVASGVLYHMKNPAELLALLTKRCQRSLFLWTHYYDEALIAKNPRMAHKLTGSVQATYQGFEHTLYRHDYQEAKYMPGFSGAGGGYSHWMTRDDILNCLTFFGFGDIQIGFDDPNSKNGPSFALIARPQQ